MSISDRGPGPLRVRAVAHRAELESSLLARTRNRGTSLFYGANPATAEGRLARLRELVVAGRAVPMSASCMVNRVEVLGRDRRHRSRHLPDEVAAAQRVIEIAGSSARPTPRPPDPRRSARARRPPRPAQRDRPRRRATRGEDPSRRRGGGGGAAARDRHVHRLPDGRLRVGPGEDDHPGPDRPQPARRAQPPPSFNRDRCTHAL